MFLRNCTNGTLRIGIALAIALISPEARSQDILAKVKPTNKNLQVGVFSGGFNIPKAEEFDTFQNRTSAFNVEFIDYTINCAIMGGGWGIGQWVKNGKAVRNNMLFSIPIGTLDLSKNPQIYGGTYTNVLQAIAGGVCDKDYKNLAEKAAQYYPNAIIRIGHEFNGGWYIWTSTGREADYVAAFRRIAKIFRNASPKFTIMWNPASGNFPYNNKTAVPLSYPGDDVVDEIGLDIYDLPDKFAGSTATKNSAGADVVAHWNAFLDQPWGLNWVEQFAKAHKKTIGFPEWGTGSPGKGWADGPVTAYWLTAMYNWMITHNVVHEAYWNGSQKTGYDSNLYDKPALGQAYINTFAQYPYNKPAKTPPQ